MFLKIDMSIRTMVALAMAITILPATLLLAVAIWMFPDTASEGGMPMAVWATIGAFALLLGCGFGAWWIVDRNLLARQHDRRNLPARPEFFDFHLLDQPMHWDEIEGKSLKGLRYVVFDLETTGLRPSFGDEIISIGAVVVENGAIDEAQSFTRLVNPGKPIAPASIPFHGITDDMVAEESTIDAVLPQFRDFIGNAILVAHNSAFDMKFLSLKEEPTGVAIDNLVLDTMLLSVVLEHESENHSLDGIANRMGLTIEGRHTALGDSIATARILLKQFDRLEARGITTLRQAVQASAKVEQVRRLSEKF